MRKLCITCVVLLLLLLCNIARSQTEVKAVFIAGTAPSVVDLEQNLKLVPDDATPSVAAANSQKINAYLASPAGRHAELRASAKKFYFAQPSIVPPGCLGAKIVGAGGRPFIVDQIESVARVTGFTTFVWIGNDTDITGTATAGSRTITVANHTVTDADRWKTLDVQAGSGVNTGLYTVVCVDPSANPQTMTLDRAPGNGSITTAYLRGSMILNQSSGLSVEGIYFSGIANYASGAPTSASPACAIQTMPYSQSGEYTGTINSSVVTVTGGGLGAIQDSDSRLDVYWKNGFRLDCNPGTPSGQSPPYTVGVSGGSGDTLPTGNEPVTVVRYTGAGAGTASIRDCSFASMIAANLCGMGLNQLGATASGYLWEDASLHADHMEYRNCVYEGCTYGIVTRNTQSVNHRGDALHFLINTPNLIYHERGGRAEYTAVRATEGTGSTTLLRVGKESGNTNASGTIAIRGVQLEQVLANPNTTKILVCEGPTYTGTHIAIENVSIYNPGGVSPDSPTVTVKGGWIVDLKRISEMRANNVLLDRDGTSNAPWPTVRLDMCRLYLDQGGIQNDQETVLHSSSTSGSHAFFRDCVRGWETVAGPEQRDNPFAGGCYKVGTGYLWREHAE